MAEEDFQRQTQKETADFPIHSANHDVVYRNYTAVCRNGNVVYKNNDAV